MVVTAPSAVHWGGEVAILAHSSLCSGVTESQIDTDSCDLKPGQERHSVRERACNRTTPYKSSKYHKTTRERTPQDAHSPVPTTLMVSDYNWHA